MKMIRGFIPAAILLFIAYEGFAQLSLGLVNGNYSGSAGLAINPSSMANSRLKADVSIFSLSSFIANNYFYLPAKEANVYTLVAGIYEFPFYAKPYGKGERNIYSYYQDKSHKDIFVQAKLIGPSFMFSARGHEFALRLGFRAVSSTRRLPYDIANFSFYAMDFKPQHNIYFVRENYNMASMAWWDLSFSYATVFKRSNHNLWSAGISAGPALGYSGAYISADDTRYIVYNDSILNVDLLNAELGLALPVDYQEDNVDLANPLIRGFGWGMDIGITWHYCEKRMQGSAHNEKFEDYKFKLGISLMDIGWVRFTRNAERHVYGNVSNHWINVSDLEYDNIRDELDVTSEIFYGNPDASLRSREFRIFLPASLSMQLDYHLSDHLYLNGTFILPAWFLEPAIVLPILAALTPRFEKGMFEINLPLIIYDLKYPHFGLSVRIAGLTIGTDHMAGFLGFSDFTGVDLYISYKVNLQNNGKNPYTFKGACFNDF